MAPLLFIYEVVIHTRYLTLKYRKFPVRDFLYAVFRFATLHIYHDNLMLKMRYGTEEQFKYLIGPLQIRADRLGTYTDILLMHACTIPLICAPL